MAGIFKEMAEVYEAEQAGLEPLDAVRAEALRARHETVVTRAAKLAGRCTLGRVTESSVFSGNAAVRYYEHQWRTPLPAVDEGKPLGLVRRGEPHSVYVQIGARSLRHSSAVEAYEVRTYAVPNDLRPDQGPDYGFRPAVGERALYTALPERLLVQDERAVDEFALCLDGLEAALNAVTAPTE